MKTYNKILMLTLALTQSSLFGAAAPAAPPEVNAAEEARLMAGNDPMKNKINDEFYDVVSQREDYESLEDYFNAIRKLLATNLIDINKPLRKDGRFPLGYVISVYRSPEIVNFFLENGATPTFIAGAAVIHHLMLDRDLAIARLLLSKNQKLVNERFPDGKPILANYKMSQELLQELLKYKPDLLVVKDAIKALEVDNERSIELFGPKYETVLERQKKIALLSNYLQRREAIDQSTQQLPAVITDIIAGYDD